MILILADIFDSHADSVQDILIKNGSKFTRVNLDVGSLQNTSISLGERGWLIRQRDQEFCSTEINCVWARRLTVSLTLEQQNVEEGPSSKIWRSEWNRCLYGLYASMRTVFWMNPIAKSALSDNKYYQFDVARSIGFQIPQMTSSNIKTKLLKFAEDNGEVAIKFMAQDIYKTQSGEFMGAYVNKITSSDLIDFGEFGENPITLQKYINKDYEVRHTYVDGSHFSCKIESQQSGRANVDWRRYDIANTPHSLINPPEKVKSMINILMDKLGLYYGAFDFIVDKDGTWWYLEVNSSGQWLWIEDLVGLPISARIAESLSQRSLMGN